MEIYTVAFLFGIFLLLYPVIQGQVFIANITIPVIARNFPLKCLSVLLGLIFIGFGTYLYIFPKIQKEHNVETQKNISNKTPSNQKTKFIPPISQINIDWSKFQKLELGGVVNSESLVNKIKNDQDIKLNADEEESLLKLDNFFNNFTEICSVNKHFKTDYKPANIFNLKDNTFYYNGDFQLSDNILTYWGYGRAWTEKKYNLFNEKIIVRAIVEAGEKMIDPNRGNHELEFGYGISFSNNTRHWAGDRPENGDAITLAVFNAIARLRSEVYKTDLDITFAKKNKFLLDPTKKHEIIAEFSKDYLSLKTRALDETEFKHVLYKSLDNSLIKKHNIPLCGHIVLLTFGNHAYKKVITSFDIKTEKI